jgi:hypothetical protein
MNVRKVVMHPSFKTRTAIRLCALVLGLCAFSVCVAQALEPAARPEYQVGDRWSYRNVAGAVHTQQVLGIDADAITVAIGNGRARVTRDFNFPRTYDGKTTLDERLTFPLQLGKEWSSSFEWKAGNVIGKTDMTRRVVAYERIRVDAGEFDAFRIEGKGFWKDLTTITSFPAHSSGPRTERYWYAPAARRIVKFEGQNLITTQFDRIDYNDTYELVEMQLVPTRP